MNDTAAFGDLRVLDLTGSSGSYAGKLFADLGADVIRIESPKGDPGRTVAPLLQDSAVPVSLHWLYTNTSKRSVVLDLQTAEGRETFTRLLFEADVLLDTERFLLKSLDISRDALQAANPGLIHASLTPFGLTGPRRDWQATDIVASAAGGLLYLGGMPNRPPSWPGGEQSYLIGAAAMATGVGMALVSRDDSGRGQRIDVSLQEATIVATENAIGFWTFLGQIRRRIGTQSWGRATVLGHATDGWVVGHIGGRWAALLDWMESHGSDVAQFRAEEWFQNPYRTAHMDEFEPVILDFLSKLPKEQIYREGQQRRIVFGPVRSTADVMEDPQMIEREFWVELHDANIGKTITFPGAPYCLSSTPWSIRNAAPALGADTPEWNAERQELVQRNSTKKLPLEGIRVVDFGNQVVVPMVSKVLTMFGAEVIKIEARNRGGMRYTLFPKPPGKETPNTNWLFINVNTDKKSMTLDLGKEEARDLTKKLISQADIVMDNFGVDPLPKWGMSAEDLLNMKPDLIILRCSVMGRTGSYSNYIGLGNSIMAKAGLTGITGFEGEPPVGTCTAHPDYSSNAHHALFALLASLHHRNKTGKGQYIDLSQTESTVCFIGPSILNFTANGVVEGPNNNRHPQIAPHGAFQAAGDDRWIAIACPDDLSWKALAGLIDRPLVNDSRFASLADRKANEDELNTIVSAWTVDKEPFALAKTLQRAGVPASVAETSQDLLEHDDHLAARGAFITIEHSEAGETIVVQPHFKLLETPGTVRSQSPILGADNDWVVEELLALDPETVANLYVAEAIQ